MGSRLYERFASAVEARGIKVGRGVFGAEMEVELVNDGPMTIWLDYASDGRTCGLSRGTSGGLLESADAARADERAAGSGSVAEAHRLKVRLHATVRADAVHTDGLGVEAAHRYLAADCAQERAMTLQRLRIREGETARWSAAPAIYYSTRAQRDRLAAKPRGTAHVDERQVAGSRAAQR